MPTYTLTDLAKLADVTPRTIRFYITSGLLPSPGQQGPSTRYDDAHLELLRVIRKLQNAHLPLAEIRARLRSITNQEMASIASSPDDDTPADSAVDYIRRVIGGPNAPPPRAPVASTPAPAASTSAPVASTPAPAASTSAPAVGVPAPAASEDTQAFYRTMAKEPETQRSQWERIPLDPDVELHIRRPLTRQHNKRVERLITIARQLFEED